MTNTELIDKLSKYKPDTEVVVVSYVNEHDSYCEHIITAVHDAFNRDFPHDMISIECEM